MEKVSARRVMILGFLLLAALTIAGSANAQVITPSPVQTPMFFVDSARNVWARVDPYRVVQDLAYTPVECYSADFQWWNMGCRKTCQWAPYETQPGQVAGTPRIFSASSPELQRRGIKPGYCTIVYTPQSLRLLPLPPLRPTPVGQLPVRPHIDDEDDDD